VEYLLCANIDKESDSLIVMALHSEAYYIDKVITKKQKLLFTMGKDYREGSESALFIKIWDFKTLIDGVVPGCKTKPAFLTISTL